jgi:magnesium and cobalt transporter
MHRSIIKFFYDFFQKEKGESLEVKDNIILAEDILMSRNKIPVIYSGSSIDDVLDAFMHFKNDYLIVCRENLDNIIGYISVFDMLIYNNLNKEKKFTPERHLKDVSFVSLNTELNIILNSINENRGVCIVLDDFGGTAGAIDKNSIISFFNRNKNIISSSGGDILIHGTTTLDQVRHFLPEDLYIDAESKTVGGILTEFLGRSPKQNEKIKIENALLTVLSLEDRTIGTILIQKIL